MARWTCPRCDRQFGRSQQSHVCVPGNTVAATFGGRPPVYRELYDAMITHLKGLGRVHEDAVRVGVFLVRDRKLAEIRPKARSLNACIYLPRALEHSRVATKVPIAAGRTVNVVKLTKLEDVDEQLLEWLTEAFEAAGE